MKSGSFGGKPRPFAATDGEKVRYFTVSDDSCGRRIDNYLLTHFKTVPKSHIYRIIRSGQVRVNSGRVRPSQRIKPGDVIRVPPMSVTAPRRPHISAKAVQRLEHNIIFEDEYFILVNKPGGAVVHSGSRHNVGLVEVSRHLRDQPCFSELVHRLDRGTSGCLLFAKTREALVSAQRAFYLRQVKKIYTTLVVGHWDKDVSGIAAPLAINSRARREKVIVDRDLGKPAATDFEVIGSFPECTLLKAMPKTGRMHQIRVHAAACGHPVAGDRRYGDDVANRCFYRLGLRRLFLHADQLQLSCMGRQYDFQAPIAEDLNDFLEKINVESTGVEPVDF